jgi:hypothetical protein
VNIALQATQVRFDLYRRRRFLRSRCAHRSQQTNLGQTGSIFIRCPQPLQATSSVVWALSSTLTQASQMATV